MADWAAERGIESAVVEAGRMRNPLDYLRTVRSLMGHIRSWQPDVVFSWMTKAHLYAGAAAKVTGVPAAWFNHTITDRGWMDRATTMLPAAWVAVPSEVAKRAQTRLFRSPTCHVIYPGIDIAEFAPVSLPLPEVVRQEFGIPTERRIIGTVARLQRWKGVHVFLQAVAAAAKLHPDLHAMVVGGPHFSEPDYPEELRQLARSLGIADRVTFTGHRQDVARLMNAFDCFVHSSALPEPGGMTVMEAMALGKPVIATRAGGPTETVVDGVTGLLVAPNDVGEMARALDRLLSDPALGLCFTDAASERARQHFSAEVMARRTVSLLRQIPKSPVRSGSGRRTGGLDR